MHYIHFTWCRTPIDQTLRPSVYIQAIYIEVQLMFRNTVGRFVADVANCVVQRWAVKPTLYSAVHTNTHACSYNVILLVTNRSVQQCALVAGSCIAINNMHTSPWPDNLSSWQEIMVYGHICSLLASLIRLCPFIAWACYVGRAYWTQ